MRDVQSSMGQTPTNFIAKMETERKDKTEKGRMKAGPMFNTSSSDLQQISSILTIATSAENTVGSDVKLKRDKVPHTFFCAGM